MSAGASGRVEVARPVVHTGEGSPSPCPRQGSGVKEHRLARSPVLIVEDHPDSLELLTVLVESRGHRVIAATNGCDALKLARQDRPGLIILDLMLPLIDGAGVLREIARDPGLSEIPVLVCSASPDTEKTALNGGASDWLQKPWDVDTLLQKLESLYRSPVP